MEFEKVVKISVEKIVVPEGRLRKNLGDVEDLARSIKLAGSLQPIVVRPLEDGRYELVLGERRLKAMQQLGYSEIPAIVRPYDKRTARLAEIEENVRRLDYDSVERAKAIAEYCEIVKEILGEPKLGRPEALTPEQVDQARELRDQGKSLKEIAELLKVDEVTVWRHLKKAEKAVQATAETIAKPITALSVLQEKTFEEEFSEKLPERAATRAVAEELGFSQPAIVKATKVAEAIKKYPMLERLGKSAYVTRLAQIADFWKMSREELETAVDLILTKDVGPEFAASLSRLTHEEREKLLEICRKENVPEDIANMAARTIFGSRGVNMTPEVAVKHAFMYKCVEFRVPLPRYEVLQALEEAAVKEGVKKEIYIALAVLEKLLDEGYIKDSSYNSAAEVLRTQLYLKV
jgi:ParB-like chromosome segregation protein Spo0J